MMGADDVTEQERREREADALEMDQAIIDYDEWRRANGLLYEYPELGDVECSHD